MAETHKIPSGFLPFDQAPRDGTWIQALIPGHGSDNVIAWCEGAFMNDAEESCGGWSFMTDQEPPDCWTDGVCWTSNDCGVPSMLPTAFKPLPAN